MSNPRRSRLPAGADRVRMADVARLAGVSAITVSRVLRDPGKVSEATRLKVAEAIRQSRYVPDLVASSLASRRSRIVAVIVPTMANSIFSDTVQGAADFLRARGYQLIIGDSGYSAAEEERLTAALLGHRPDGLILTGVDHQPGARRLITERRVPVIETWDLTDTPIDAVVGFSNYDAGYAMAAHLAGRGYRRIAYIGPPSADRRSEHRRAGCLAALRDRGLEGVLETASGSGLGAGGAALERLLAREPEVDAVFFSSDIPAVGGLFACQRRGWSVPGRVAVAGLGDFDIAAEVAPALTTIRVPRYEMGREAARLLVDRLDGAAPSPTRVDLGFEVVARASA